MPARANSNTFGTAFATAIQSGLRIFCGTQKRQPDHSGDLEAPTLTLLLEALAVVGLMMWLDRVQTGRFKVFREMGVFWDEFNLYHRKDGKVFAENDDLLRAVRYALMMLRFARTEAARSSFNRKVITYPPGYFQHA
jgi:hypothetical protein